MPIRMTLEEVINKFIDIHGDYWHGNPAVFDPDDCNKHIKKSFNELYTKTTAEEKVIREAGYNLVVMWENDWNNLKKNVA